MGKNRIQSFSEFINEAQTYKYPGDNSYEYRVNNGKWETKRIGGSTWRSLANFPSTIEKLNKKFPNALKTSSSSSTSSPDLKGSDFTNPDASLYFDGLKLYWMVNGKKVTSWDAISGLTPLNAKPEEWGKLMQRYTSSPEEFAKKKNAGPLPPGKYKIGALEERKGDHTAVSVLSAVWDKMVGNYSTVTTKEKEFQSDNNFSRLSWGNFRAPIFPEAGTPVYGRGGFYIHGGTLPGSHGCIDLTDEMDDFGKKYGTWMAATKKRSIPLTVNYDNYNLKRLIEPIKKMSTFPAITIPGTELINSIIKNLWTSNEYTPLPGDSDKIIDPMKVDPFNDITGTDPYANIA